VARNLTWSAHCEIGNNPYLRAIENIIVEEI
jgi:hypothetical protein